MAAAKPKFTSTEPNAQRRSWIRRFQLRDSKKAPPDPLKLSSRWAMDHKPSDDMADLLIMSTRDSRTPPEAPGTADLLSELVDHHLEGDTARTELTEVSAEPGTSTQALSEIERAEMLQREIQTLLGEPRNSKASGTGTAAIAEPDSQTNTAPPGPTPPPQDVPGTASSAPPLSAGELDVLLAGGNEAPARLEQAPHATRIEDAQIEQTLSEAEGVLAEELTQLMAECEGAPSVPAAPLSSAGHVAKTENVEEIPSAPSTAALPSPPAASDVTPENAASAPASQSIAPPPAESISPETVATPAGFFARLRAAAGDLALMVAQLADLPFAWISEVDKNILGIAAFLLFLGGAALWIISQYIS